MAVDMFLKVAGVSGESVDKVHAGEIDVLSWGWGVTQTGTTHTGGGGGAGKANVQDVTITKYLDKGTPILLKFCLSGAHIPECLLTVRKAGTNPLEYVKVKMKDAIISSINTGGSGADERLTETLGINFANVEFEYTGQKNDGSGDASIPITWNIATNSES